MLKYHASHHNVSTKDEFYWICTFANNQHCLDDLSPDDYKETPFARAILGDQFQGTNVVLNEGEATPFTRSRCIFEAFVSLTIAKGIKANPHLIDFANIISAGECEQVGGGLYNERCAGLLYEVYDPQKL